MNTFEAIDIIEGEVEDVEREDVIAAYQHLIDTEIVWSLQGSYGRAARDLVICGECLLPQQPEGLI